MWRAILPPNYRLGRNRLLPQYSLDKENLMSGVVKKAASTVSKGMTGCEMLRGAVNALTKHMLPVQGPGRVQTPTELTNKRLQNGYSIPANTSGVSKRQDIGKSFVDKGVLHEFTPMVHQTQVKNMQATSSSQISGPAYMKFNLKKKGHFEGFAPFIGPHTKP